MENIWSDVRNTFVAKSNLESNKLHMKDMDVKDSTELYFLTTKEQIKQYSNLELYQFEKRLREWFKIKLEDPLWTQGGHGGNINRSYRMGDVIREVFGRDWISSVDGKYTAMYSKVLRYYCSTVNSNAYDKKRKKWIAKTEYRFSITRVRELNPYSLRLRYEECIRDNKDIDKISMQLPKDNLEIGHARNPKTEKNKEIKRQRAKEAYERYRENQKRLQDKR